MNQKIQDIIQKHKKQVKVSCDEYHSHSVDQNCLIGPQASIDVLILASYISKLEDKIQDAANATK